MLIRLANGRVVDPASGRDAIGDVYIRDSHVDEPRAGETPDATYDLSGKVVMAGAIDIHSHIGGGNVNTARLLLAGSASAQRARRPIAACDAGWSTFETGCLYAEMGFTTVVEPAMSAASRVATPISSSPTSRSSTSAASPCSATMTSFSTSATRREPAGDRGLCRPGRSTSTGASASRSSMRAPPPRSRRTSAPSRLDDVVPSYGVSSRAIVKTLQAAVEAARHAASAACPLQQSRHPGRGRYARRDDRGGRRAADASRASPVLRLRHRGRARESRSAAARLAEVVNASAERDDRRRPGHVRPDRHHIARRPAAVLRARLGAAAQVRHCGTATAMAAASCPIATGCRLLRRPAMGGGLELFLLISDPWRVFFTTDHPNGAPFTAYPQICSSC